MLLWIKKGRAILESIRLNTTVHKRRTSSGRLRFCPRSTLARVTKNRHNSKAYRSILSLFLYVKTSRWSTTQVTVQPLSSKTLPQVPNLPLNTLSPLNSPLSQQTQVGNLFHRIIQVVCREIEINWRHLHRSRLFEKASMSFSRMAVRWLPKSAHRANCDTHRTSINWD